MLITCTKFCAISSCLARFMADLVSKNGILAGRSLTGKKSVPVHSLPKKPAGTPCVQPWLVVVGGWRLAVGGGWRLAIGNWQLVAVGGGWWRLVVGDWWRLVVVGGWRSVAASGWRRLVVGGWWLAVGGDWRLVGVGGWRLVVPWGGPSGRSLTKKKLVPQGPP